MWLLSSYCLTYFGNAIERVVDVFKLICVLTKLGKGLLVLKRSSNIKAIMLQQKESITTLPGC